MAKIGLIAPLSGNLSAFGVGMRDQNPLVYGDHAPVLEDLDPVARAEIEASYLAPMLPVAEQIARVDAVAAVAPERVALGFGRSTAAESSVVDAALRSGWARQ